MDSPASSVTLCDSDTTMQSCSTTGGHFDSRRFTELPAELRLRIHKLVFKGSTIRFHWRPDKTGVTVFTKNYVNWSEMFETNILSTHRNLLLTCQSIREQGSNCYWSETEAQFTVGWSPYRRGWPSEIVLLQNPKLATAKANIRKISVDYEHLFSYKKATKKFEKLDGKPREPRELHRQVEAHLPALVAQLPSLELCVLKGWRQEINPPSHGGALQDWETAVQALAWCTNSDGPETSLESLLGEDHEEYRAQVVGVINIT